MLYECGESTRDFGGGVFIFYFSLVFYILGAVLIKQLYHSHLLDMGWDDYSQGGV